MGRESAKMRFSREYFLAHKDEFGKSYLESQVTEEEHNELKRMIENGEINGKVYSNGVIATEPYCDMDIDWGQL